MSETGKIANKKQILHFLLELKQFFIFEPFQLKIREFFVQESSHSSTNDLASVKNDEQPTTSFGDDRGRLIYEGSLYYKNYGKNNSEIKKSTWKQFWAVLRKNNKLYLYNERPINLPYNLNVSAFLRLILFETVNKIFHVIF